MLHGFLLHHWVFLCVEWCDTCAGLTKAVWEKTHQNVLDYEKISYDKTSLSLKICSSHWYPFAFKHFQKWGLFSLCVIFSCGFSWWVNKMNGVSCPHHNTVTAYTSLISSMLCIICIWCYSPTHRLYRELHEHSVKEMLWDGCTWDENMKIQSRNMENITMHLLSFSPDSVGRLTCLEWTAPKHRNKY